MEKYRQPDQFYIDEYDRHTIQILKEMELKEQQELSKCTTEEEYHVQKMVYCVVSHSFNHQKILRARRRNSYIRGRIMEDERKDKLIQTTPQPDNICCGHCNSKMAFSGHFLDWRNNPIMFIFECPYGHAPRKVIYPDGKEFIFPKPICETCGFEIIKESKRVKNKIITTSYCTICGNKTKDILDLDEYGKEPEAILEKDRQKYCLVAEGIESDYESTIKFFNLLADIDSRNKENTAQKILQNNQIEMITILALESRLTRLIEKAGLRKLIFEKPDMRRRVVQAFSVQEAGTENTKSVKRLTNLLKNELFTTNWRLTGKIEARLGILTGKMVASESNDDLLIIAREISEGNKKQ